MRCVVSCDSTSFPWLVFFFKTLLWGSMIHKHTGRWMWQGSASVVFSTQSAENTTDLGKVSNMYVNSIKGTSSRFEISRHVSIISSIVWIWNESRGPRWCGFWWAFWTPHIFQFPGWKCSFGGRKLYAAVIAAFIFLNISWTGWRFCVCVLFPPFFSCLPGWIQPIRSELAFQQWRFLCQSDEEWVS